MWCSLDGRKPNFKKVFCEVFDKISYLRTYSNNHRLFIDFAIICHVLGVQFGINTCCSGNSYIDNLNHMQCKKLQIVTNTMILNDRFVFSINTWHGIPQGTPLGWFSENQKTEKPENQEAVRDFKNQKPNLDIPEFSRKRNCKMLSKLHLLWKMSVSMTRKK